LKAQVIEEQLLRLGHVKQEVQVEELAEDIDSTGWRTRIRLGVNIDGQAGFRRHRDGQIIAKLDCAQFIPEGYQGIAEQSWTPGAELLVVVDDNHIQHIAELAPMKSSRSQRQRKSARQMAAGRRAVASQQRSMRIHAGSGFPVQKVGAREWEIAISGFWQAHSAAAQVYSRLISEWAQPDLGATVWDLYGGVGVFAAAVADLVGQQGKVFSVEASESASESGASALMDIAQITCINARVEKVIADLPSAQVAILDPPRTGAGRAVITELGKQCVRRVIHIGCDPAAFGRDIGLYQEQGFQVEKIRAFDAFPLSHHVESIALLTR
ncbi:MAG: class I SAM-dependent RNA methyltransferase, partial [Mycobacteriaceae bacterium]